MKIRMKTVAAAPDYNYQPGQEVDVPKALALKWIEQGNAEAVGVEKETAAVEPLEKAMTPKKTRKRRSSAKSSSRKG